MAILIDENEEFAQYLVGNEQITVPKSMLPRDLPVNLQSLPGPGTQPGVMPTLPTPEEWATEKSPGWPAEGTRQPLGSVPPQPLASPEEPPPPPMQPVGTGAPTEWAQPVGPRAPVTVPLEQPPIPPPEAPKMLPDEFDKILQLAGQQNLEELPLEEIPLESVLTGKTREMPMGQVRGGTSVSISGKAGKPLNFGRLEGLQDEAKRARLEGIIEQEPTGLEGELGTVVGELKTPLQRITPTKEPPVGSKTYEYLRGKIPEEDIGRLNTQEKRFRAIKNLHDQTVREKTEEITKLSEEIGKTTIDPNRFFSSKSAAERIGIALMWGLASVGAGMAGRDPSIGWNLMMKAVSDDVEAQKAQLENKRGVLATKTNMLGFLRSKFAEDRDAEIFLHEQLLGQVDRKLGYLQNQTTNDFQREQLQNMRNQTELQRQQLRATIADKAAQQRTNELLTQLKIYDSKQETIRGEAQIEINKKKLELDSKELNFKMGLAKKGDGPTQLTDAGMKALTQQKTGWEGVNKLEAKWNEKTGFFSPIQAIFPWSSSAEYNTLREAYVKELTKMLTGAQFSEAEMQRYLDMVPSASRFKDYWLAGTQFNGLRDLFMTDYNNLYYGYGQSGYYVGGITPPAVLQQQTEDVKAGKPFVESTGIPLSQPSRTMSKPKSFKTY